MVKSLCLRGKLDCLYLSITFSSQPCTQHIKTALFHFDILGHDTHVNSENDLANTRINVGENYSLCGV